VTDHVTVVFTIKPEPFVPDGAHPAWGMVHAAPSMVAFCLCGWGFVGSWTEGPLEAEGVAHTLAMMKSHEHIRRVAEGVTE
jgi:hypothetical protein